MKQTKELFAYNLIELFPEKAPSLKQHYEDYGELKMPPRISHNFGMLQKSHNKAVLRQFTKN